MKDQNNKVTAVLFVVALALAPMVQAAIEPQGGPSGLRAAPTARPRPAALARPDRTPVNLAADDSANNDSTPANSLSARSKQPTVTIFSTDNVIRGKTGTFVLHMKNALMLSGTYVNFSVGGTAVNGVDYKLLASPAYISKSGYAVIQIETLANARGSAFQQALSVVITLEKGAGYALGTASSATMWIK